MSTNGAAKAETPLAPADVTTPNALRHFVPARTTESLQMSGPGPDLGAYDAWTAYGTDACATAARDSQNQELADRLAYNTSMSASGVMCQSAVPSRPLVGGVRVPGFVYDHPSLRVQRVNDNGVADACNVETYNSLRHDPNQLTHGRCRRELHPRLFSDVPGFRPGGDVELSSRLSLGDASASPCMPRKELMERHFGRGDETPMAENVRNRYRDPATLVSPLVRGGEITRRVEGRYCAAR